MTLPAVDTFARADGELAAGSANWAKCHASSGDMSIQSGSVITASANENGYRWAGDAFPADHYGQVLIQALTNAVFIGPAARVQAGVYSYYGWYSDTNDSYPFKQVAGTWTQFGTTLPPFVAGETIRIEVSSGALTLARDGALEALITDSALTGGAAGLCGQANNAGAGMDNFEGGVVAPFDPGTGGIALVVTQPVI